MTPSYILELPRAEALPAPQTGHPAWGAGIERPY